MEVVYGGNDIENLEENNIFDGKGSLYGLTKNRICEKCENLEKFIPLEQSVRQCQACAKRKYLVEKKPFQDFHVEELNGEERLEMEYDNKDKPLLVPSKLEMDMNMTSMEQWNDNTKISCNENFVVKHEHVDTHTTANVVKASNLISSEDGKVVKKKQSILSNNKDCNIHSTCESILKRENFGYLKERFLLEKDVLKFNKRKEQTIEVTDKQKSKEEIELERRERGWVVNGKNASHSMPMKNVVTLNGYLPRKEQQEMVKVKALKEKLDTQRILGLVARRSESRITSPTHKRHTNKIGNDEVKAQCAINMINNVLPSITSHEKNLETLKSYEMHYELSTHCNSGSFNNENDGKPLHFKINERALNQEQCMIQKVDLESKYSSPTNLNYHTSDNPLYGPQQMIQLLAKKNGSKVTSPQQNFESSRIKESESSNVVFHSSTLQDQQQDPSIEVTLPVTSTTSKISYNNNDSPWNKVKKKISNSSPNHRIGYQTQIHNTHQSREANFELPIQTNCQFDDNPLNGTHRILELIAQRSESNMKSNHTKKITNVATQLYSKENQDITPSKTTHLVPTLYNQNESVHQNNGKIFNQNSK